MSVLVAIYTWVFLAMQGFSDAGPMAHHFAERPFLTYLHFGFAPFALALGGFQFLAEIREKRPRVHRLLGRIYVVSCLLSAIGGFGMALTTEMGAVAVWGFATLAVVWASSTVQAYRYARNRRFVEHRKWMIRSFSLTFAAVMLRIYLPGFVAIWGFEAFPVFYPVVAWLCWVPNVLFAEWYIRKVI